VSIILGLAIKKQKEVSVILRSIDKLRRIFFVFFFWFLDPHQRNELFWFLDLHQRNELLVWVLVDVLWVWLMGDFWVYTTTKDFWMIFMVIGN
jgi:hypothetical protein